MLTCKDVARLVSESLDRRLPFHQRVGLRMHLAMCGMCRTYRAQMMFLRNAVRTMFSRTESEPPGPDDSLPRESRERIQAALRDA